MATYRPEAPAAEPGPLPATPPRGPSAIDVANGSALNLLFSSDPRLVDVRPAIDALPGMTPDTILVSGAPMPWSRYTGGQRTGIIGAVLYEGFEP